VLARALGSFGLPGADAGPLIAPALSFSADADEEGGGGTLDAGACTPSGEEGAAEVGAGTDAPGTAEAGSVCNTSGRPG
jgi:hypothetical protein